MFLSRTSNNKINSLNERKSSFEELLRKDNTVSIRHRNLQVLATKIFKIKNNIALKIINEIFRRRTSSYNLWKNSSFYVKQVNSVYHNTDSLSCLSPKTWELAPEDIKQPESLDNFESKIKNWVNLTWPCRLCNIYLQNIGFI